MYSEWPKQGKNSLTTCDSDKQLPLLSDQIRKKEVNVETLKIKNYTLSKNEFSIIQTTQDE